MYCGNVQESTKHWAAFEENYWKWGHPTITRGFLWIPRIINPSFSGGMTIPFQHQAIFGTMGQPHWTRCPNFLDSRVARRWWSWTGGESSTGAASWKMDVHDVQKLGIERLIIIFSQTCNLGYSSLRQSYAENSRRHPEMEFQFKRHPDRWSSWTVEKATCGSYIQDDTEQLHLWSIWIFPPVMGF